MAEPSESQPPPEKPPATPPEKLTQADAGKSLRSEGWIDKLARKSAGLPSDQPLPRPKERDESAALWKFAGIGLEVAGTTVIFALIGIYLDHRLGWTPWGAVGGAMIGMIGGIYLLIKEAIRINK